MGWLEVAAAEASILPVPETSAQVTVAIRFSSGLVSWLLS